MQWNTSNMTKEDIKKKQEEYIKAAIEMSKKAKLQTDITISEPMIINFPVNEPQSEKAKETIKEVNTIAEITVKETDIEDVANVSKDIEASDVITSNSETADVTSNSDESDISPNTIEESESDEVMKSAEEIFANVFITEEEAEEKLKEAEKTLEKISEKIPDFNKYIETHNKENFAKGNTNNADE